MGWQAGFLLGGVVERAAVHVAIVMRAVAVACVVHTAAEGRVAAVAHAAIVVPEWDIRCHPGRWLWPKGIGDWLDGPIQWHCIAAPVWTKGSHP